MHCLRLAFAPSIIIAASLCLPALSHVLIDDTSAQGGADERWFEDASRAIAAEEYRATVSTAGLQAPNRAHGFRTLFGDGGITVVPREAADEKPAWRFAWQLARWGRPGRMAAAEPVAPVTNGARVTYERPGLREWYENTAKGLEQGFEVGDPPAGEGPLCLEGIVGDGLRAELDGEGGAAVNLFDAHGSRVLRYSDLVVWDAAGRDVPARLTVVSDAVSIEIEDARATYPLLVDPLMTSPAWAAEGDQGGAQFGFSVATAGDVNGDGYSDVIVAAPLYDNGETDEGLAFVYLGSASGLATAPAWMAEGNQTASWFGISVAPAGDVNGDGFSDVIVGSQQYANGQVDEGGAFVYHGSAAGLATTPAWTAEPNQNFAYFGISVATAGDVNGDGFSDVIVGAKQYDNGESNEGRTFVYLGSASGLAPSPAWTAEGNQVDAIFGYSVATAGDVNGDGFADIIVGTLLFDNGQSDEGRAQVYLGSAGGLASTAAWTAEGNQDGAQFGISVAAAGDVNGDGYGDVMVGVRFYDNGQSNEGRAYVYLGSAGGPAATPAWTAESNQADANLGYSVATAGDVNGDGYSDVIVGALGYDNGQPFEGRAYVYLGSAAGLATTSAWTAESDQALANFGYSVATAGDVNGDGYSDVMVGVRFYDNDQSDEGRAVVYLGSAAGLVATPGSTAEGNQAGAEFGWSVATAGDVNGDGFSDVIVGAYRYDNGESDEGGAFVYHGSSAGLSTTPAWTAEGNQANAQFGISVANAGDVNGDGFSDVIVGAYFYDNGENDEGRTFVYHGSGAGLATTPAWTAESNQADANFGTSVATAGDVNGDGFSDVIVGALYFSNSENSEGRAFVYYGSGTGLATAPAWTAEGNQAGALFGNSVATAGDVNGDGFSDVIVGAYFYNNGQTEEGRALIYHGSEAGLSTVAIWTAESNQANAEFGISVSTAGDVNGDGFSDVIVGANLYDNGEGDEGRAFVYHGSVTGLATAPAWTGEGNQIAAHYGTSVATAGDVNGDGFSDVILGAPYYDNGQAIEGRALAYHGSGSGLATAPAWTAESNQASAEFGLSLGTAGDVNGDGFSDVIVGAHQFDNGPSDVGRVFLYYGNGGDGLDRIARQARVDNTAPIAPLGLSDSPTSFRIKALGRTPAGRGQVRIQYEIEPYGTPFDGEGIFQRPFVDTGAPGPAGSAVPISAHPGDFDPGTLYHWRLRIATDSPFFPRSPWLTLPYNASSEADVRTAPQETAVDEEIESPVPHTRLLEGVTPNPFASATELAYTLPQRGPHRLAVYDVQGRLVALLAEGVQAAGRHTLRWGGRDAAGAPLPSGVYLLHLHVAGREAARKLVIRR